MSDEFSEINIKDEIKINIDAFVKFHLKVSNFASYLNLIFFIIKFC
jgi:hypothetical protein